MELPLLKRKRSLFDGYEEETPFCTKSCLLSALDGQKKHQHLTLCKSSSEQKRTVLGEIKSVQSERPPNGHYDTTASDIGLNGRAKYRYEPKTCLSLILSSWADTPNAVNKVLEHLQFGRGMDDAFLEDAANSRFVEFYRDIAEEFGTEDKQHSWAVLEKPEEILMYGPYYPNYNKGEHSEDIVIRQTQELLESEVVPEAWSVYIFTQNSPCLARSTGPCMLNLVWKAHEWYALYGLKTHIGYVRSWGFKGSKETQFRDLSYSQLDRMLQSHNYDSYVKATLNTAEGNLSPVCERLYAVIKQFFKQKKDGLKFSLAATSPEQDKTASFQSMYAVVDFEPQDMREVLTQEIAIMLEAVQLLPSGESDCLEGHLERGKLFALGYNFTSEMCDALRAKLRLTFEKCWREMVQGKYVECLRERLNEDFHRCTVQLFTKEIAKFAGEYVWIGRLQFTGN